jgi:predicted kinase
MEKESSKLPVHGCAECPHVQPRPDVKETPARSQDVPTPRRLGEAAPLKSSSSRGPFDGPAFGNVPDPAVTMGLMLLVVTGPIASGKSTIARAVAAEFEKRGPKAAAVDLDLIYEMLDPSRSPKNDSAIWAQARRMSARLAAALLAEDVTVIVEGEFLTAADRAEFIDALPQRVEPRFITLSVPFEVALQRAGEDETRGLSRQPELLRAHYDATVELRDVPSTDLTLDTAAIQIEEAARVATNWALRQQA